jgi:hypothetical protein
VANIDSLLRQPQLHCPPTYIVSAPLTLQRVVANIDSLLWQPQLHCPPTYIVAAQLTLQRVVANIDSLLWQPQFHCPPTYILSQPRLLYSMLWQTLTPCCGKQGLGPLLALPCNSFYCCRFPVYLTITLSKLMLVSRPRNTLLKIKNLFPISAD